MKRALLPLLSAVLLVSLAACGYGGSSSGSSTTPAGSKLTNKAFVTNEVGNGTGLPGTTRGLNVVNAANDTLTNFSVVIGGTPTSMFVSQDKSTTMVFESQGNGIEVVDNPTEGFLGSIPLAGFSESFLSTKDGKTGYAAIRNGIAGNPIPGLIDVLDLRSQFVVTSTIPIPNVRFISSNHAVNRLLAFSENATDNAPAVFSIDLTQATLTPVQVTGTPTVAFSHPVAAYFSDDDSKAYILSCGVECGGTQAMVTELTIATGATRSVNVNAARVGTLQGTTLYVTGSPSATDCIALAQPATCGVVQKVDVSAMTASPAVPIGLGSHTVIQFAGNKVWIGAQACLGNGCLSIFDPTANSVQINPPNGDVTSIATIPGRDVLYIIEGAELRIYTIATGTPQATQIDIVGPAFAAASVSNP